MVSAPYPLGPSWAVAPRDWGAIVDYDQWDDPWFVKDKMVAHYGGGANTAGSVTGVFADQLADEREVLRGWESFHVNGRGWRGLAYCWAVGQSGTVYRVRGWNQNGAHYGNDDVDYDGISENVESLPVVFILGGDQVPTAAALAAFERLRSWLQEQLGVQLKLWGHQEVAASGGHSTSCPGVPLMTYVRANRFQSSIPPEVTVRDPVVWPDLLRRGDADKSVISLRGLLFGLGFYGKRYLKSSRFTGSLEKRVVSFQKEHGLTADGVVGPMTREALLGATDTVVGG